jgi:hypothetical protein
MKTKIALGLITLVTAFNFFASGAMGQEEQKDIKRFSLEVGGGYNVIFPFFHASTSYRLPVMNDSLAVFVHYSPINIIGFPAPLQAFYAGVKYYDPTDSYYFNIGAGVGFRSGATSMIGHNTNDFINPAFVVGIGRDLKITDNLGITLEINASYPFLVRGAGSIRLSL